MQILSQNKKNIREKIQEKKQIVWQTRADIIADFLFILLVVAMVITIAGLLTQNKPCLVLGILSWVSFLVILRLARKHKF